MFYATRWRLTGAALLLSCALAPSAARAEKAGFEYFKSTPVASSHILHASAEEIYAIAPNASFYGAPARGQQNYRIIDIRIDSASDDGWTFSAAFIENSGVYQRKSWFLYNLSYAELLLLNKVEGWIAIDVERAYIGTRELLDARFAVVLVECPEKYKWYVYSSVEQWFVDVMLGSRISPVRPLDIDAYDNPLAYDAPDPSIVRFDMIVVENTRANFVDTQSFFCSWEEVGEMGAAGWQVIDIQRAPQTIIDADPEFECHAIFVKTENSFWVQSPGTDEDFQELEVKYGRMIDLKAVSPEAVDFGDNNMATFLAQ